MPSVCVPTLGATRSQTRSPLPSTPISTARSPACRCDSAPDGLETSKAGPGDRPRVFVAGAGSHAPPAKGALNLTWRMRPLQAPEQNEQPARIQAKRLGLVDAVWIRSKTGPCRRVLQHVALHFRVGAAPIDAWDYPARR